MFNATNKVYIMIFLQVISPLSLIAGLVIQGIANDSPVLPEGFKANLNWFQQNVETSNTIATVLYVVAGVLVLLTIFLSMSVAQGGMGTEDEKLGKRLGVR